MKFSKDLKVFFFYFLLFIVGCVIMPKTYVWGYNDRNCWFSWCNYIHHFGVQNIYKLRVDYPPLVHYFLWLLAKFLNSSERIFLNIYKLKYMVLFIEVISVFFVYKILKLNKIKYAHLLPLLILFNIAFWYNNALFGQVDGVYTAFAFISLTFAILKRPSLSLLFFVLCVNFKLQGIIFFPIIAIVLFNETKRYGLSQIVLTLLPAVLLQIVLMLPFVYVGDFKLALNSFSESMGRYPLISMGAYNIWSLIFDAPQLMNDNLGVFNFSYNSFGLMAFFGLSGFVLLPFAVKSLGVFDKTLKLDLSFENVLLACVLIILSFSYFNTQMHARYSHPIILFAGTLAILRKGYLKFLLVSLAVFLNMEGASKILKGNIAEFETVWFQPWFVSILFLMAIILYSVDYVILIKKSIHWRS
jgi:Gpi18-like mannosyltransferase